VAAEDKALVAGPEGRMPLKLSEKHFQSVVDTLDTSNEHFVSWMVFSESHTFFKKILIVIAKLQMFNRK
jgi:hypothetical protein